MRLRYTDAALAELAGIQEYQKTHWPTVRAAFVTRLESVHSHITVFPEAAPEVAQRPGVRVMGLLPYPYRLFYRATGEWIEVLHIRHVAQKTLDGG